MTLLLALALVAAQDGGLVNPGFERPLEEGWTVAIGATNGGESPASTVERDEDEAHGGRASLHFSGDGATRGWRIVKQDLPLHPGGRYELSAWTKTAGVTREGNQFHNCYLMLIFRDAAGSTAARVFDTPGLPTSDWTRRTVRTTAPWHATEAELMIFLSMTGDFWVDDLELSIEEGAERELLFRETFEKAKKLPSKWKTRIGARNGSGGEDSRIEVDAERGAGDSKRSLRLSGNADTRRWHHVNRTAKVETGRVYQLEADVRTNGVAQEGIQFANLHMNLQFLDKKGNPLATAAFEDLGTGDSVWTRRAVRATAPDGAASVRAGLFLSMTGTVWFDDVELWSQPNDDERYTDWEVLGSKEVYLRYPPDHPNAKEMKAYLRRLRDSRAATCRALKVDFPEPITVFIYTDNDQGRRLTGGSLDFADPKGRKVHQGWNSYIGHEMVHVIAHNQLGYGKTGILGGGHRRVAQRPARLPPPRPRLRAAAEGRAAERARDDRRLPRPVERLPGLGLLRRLLPRHLRPWTPSRRSTRSRIPPPGRPSWSASPSPRWRPTGTRC